MSGTEFFNRAKKILALLLLAVFVSSNLYAKSDNPDTLATNHLLLKTDILVPVGLLMEYKTRSRFSYQLSGYFLIGPYRKQDYEDIQINGSYMVNATFRYYIRNHFVGLYLQYAHLEDNVSMYAPFKQVYFSFGPHYGYQKEWGKFNLEGNIGLGISKNTEHVGYTKFGLYYFDDDDFYSPFVDLYLSIGIGYRIF